MEVVKKTLNEDGKDKISAEEYVRQKRIWETEMERVRAQLHNSQMVWALKILSGYNIFKSILFISILIQ